MTCVQNAAGCQAVYDALKPSRHWGSVVQQIRRSMSPELRTILCRLLTQGRSPYSTALQASGPFNGPSNAFEESTEDEPLLDKEEEDSNTSTSPLLEHEPFPGTVLRSVYEMLVERNVVVREEFLQLLHNQLRLGNACTIQIQQQATSLNKGKRKGLGLYLRCANKQCFRLKVAFIEPSADDSKVAFEVHYLRPARRHKFHGPRRMLGEYKQRVCEKASLAGGAVPFTRQLKKKLLNKETVPASVPHARAVQKAIYRGRLPPEVAQLPGFNVESLRHLHRSQGIEFVRTCSAVPFQVTFATDQQLEIYSKYSNKLLYLDATGRLVRRENNHSPHVYLYSSVFESPAAYLQQGSERMALPVFEYITNSHSTVSIGWYLATMKHTLAKLPGGMKNLPRHVVIDFCWASIHAVLSSLAPQPTNLISFLQDKYRVMQKKTKAGVSLKEEIFKLSLCRSHMLHAWARHKSFRAKTKFRKRQRSVLIRGALMLANAQTLSKAEKAFEKLCIVCTEDFKTTRVHQYAKEFETLKDGDADEAMASNKKKHKERMSLGATTDLSTAQAYKQVLFDDAQLPTLDSINKQSPFAKHFENVYRKVRGDMLDEGGDLQDWNKAVCDSEDNSEGSDEDGCDDLVEEDDDSQEGTNENPYKNRDFLNYIRFHWIPLFALWSVITAGKDPEDPDDEPRVPTNGYVERYFGEVKLTRLYSRQPLAPVPLLQRHLQFLQDHSAAILADLENWPKDVPKRGRKRGCKSKRGRVPYDQPAVPVCPTADAKKQEEREVASKKRGRFQGITEFEAVPVWKSSPNEFHAENLSSFKFQTPLRPSTSKQQSKAKQNQKAQCPDAGEKTGLPESFHDEQKGIPIMDLNTIQRMI
jgi:hypothetical protein